MWADVGETPAIPSQPRYSGPDLSGTAATGGWSCSLNARGASTDAVFIALLEHQVAVTSEKNIEPVFNGEGEEFPVSDTAPAHLLRRRSAVSGEGTPQAPV